MVRIAAPYSAENLNQQHPTHFIRFDTRGAPLDTLASLPEEQFLVVTDPAFGFAVGDLPYRAKNHAAFAEDGVFGPTLFVARNDSVVIHMIEIDGDSREAELHLPLERAAVPEDEIDRLLESIDPLTGRMLRTGREQVPDYMPAFAIMLADGSGRLWIDVVLPGERQRLGETGYTYLSINPGEMPNEWWVVSPGSGSFIKTSMPPNFRPYFVSDSMVHGTLLSVHGVHQFAAMKMDHSKCDDG